MKQMKIYTGILTASLCLTAMTGCGAVTTDDSLDGLKYTIENGSAIITDCKSSETDIFVPAEIEGCPVTALKEKCFQGCKKLTIVTLPNSLKTIGDHAFSGCTELEQVNIPEGLSEIGAYAFEECDSLVVLYLPENITSIGEKIVASDQQTRIFCQHGSKSAEQLEKNQIPFSSQSVS